MLDIKKINKRQNMDQLSLFNTSRGFSFYWFYYTQVYPLQPADL
jgi:hypothetical protein